MIEKPIVAPPPRLYVDVKGNVLNEVDYFSRWRLRDVKVTSKRSAVIKYHIPNDVNTLTEIHVRLRLLDRLAGINIEQKTNRILQRWQCIFDRLNKDLEELEAMTKRIKSGLNHDEMS